MAYFNIQILDKSFCDKFKCIASITCSQYFFKTFC